MEDCRLLIALQLEMRRQIMKDGDKGQAVSYQDTGMVDEDPNILHVGRGYLTANTVGGWWLPGVKKKRRTAKQCK